MCAAKEIKAGRGFRIYRDRIRTGARPIEQRRQNFERTFKTLKKAGVKRGSLYLAWDFTVASERSLAGRMLHIRDDAFGTLGDTNLKDLKVAGQSPSVSVDTVTDYTPAQDDRIARKVEGHIMVPCYLTNACAPGGSFRFDNRGLLRRMGVTSVPFVCNIPRSALDPSSPVKARASLYGHGLLGRASEIDAGNVKSMSNEHNFVFCATAGAGFANEDIAHIISVLGDFSGFNTVADRMQQGFLNMLFLGRAMIHPGGLSAQAAFQKNGQSVLDTTRLFFDGNSQGGIMGGALTAVRRLRRAASRARIILHVAHAGDFDTYAEIYPRIRGDRSPAMALPDPSCSGEGARRRYAHHMTGDPLNGNHAAQRAHHVAFGDIRFRQTAEASAHDRCACYQRRWTKGRSPGPSIR